MPILEAPINFDDESSPENSLNGELAGANVVPAIAQLRIHAPEPVFVANRRGGNAFGGIRLPTIRLLAQRPNVQAQGAVDTIITPARPLHRDIFAALEAEANEALSWHGTGPAPPPVVNLLPVTLPRQVAEPQLDELLRRVTQRNDLHNVETVRLRVISAITVSLSRLAMFLPRLQHLDLNGSVLCSLRDLGCGLTHLTHLNVSNCGLTSFDGTSGMTSIRTLIADGNMIQLVGPLTQLPLLQHLSAQNNRISDLSLLTFLGMCPNLIEVQLQGNPVCHLRLYRHTLERNICTLQRIDDTPVNNHNRYNNNNQNNSREGEATNTVSEPHTDEMRVAELNRRNALLSRTTSAVSITSTQSLSSRSTSSSLSNTASDNDALSSLSSEYNAAVEHYMTATSNSPLVDSMASFSSNSSNVETTTTAPLTASLTSLAFMRHLRRPATAPTGNTSTFELPATLHNRPASASIPCRSQQPVLQPGAVSSSIVAGSVLDLLRRSRRQQRSMRNTQAWMSESACSTSSASSNSLEPVAEI